MTQYVMTCHWVYLGKKVGLSNPEFSFTVTVDEDEDDDDDDPFDLLKESTTEVRHMRVCLCIYIHQ